MKAGGAQAPGKRRAADDGKTVNHTYETLKCNVTPRCVRDNEVETESEEEEQQDQEAVVEEMKWKLAQWMTGCKLYQAMQTYADDILLRISTAQQMADRIERLMTGAKTDMRQMEAQ